MSATQRVPRSTAAAGRFTIRRIQRVTCPKTFRHPRSYRSTSSGSAEFPGGKDLQNGTRIAHCAPVALRGVQLLQGRNDNSWNGDNSMQGKTGLIVGLAGIGLGTGLMFFLDPARGKQRRAVVRDRAKRTSRQIGKVARSVDRSAHDLARGADELTKRVFLWKRKALRLVA
jgi:hypothetical protein